MSESDLLHGLEQVTQPDYRNADGKIGEGPEEIPDLSNQSVLVHANDGTPNQSRVQLVQCTVGVAEIKFMRDQPAQR